MDDDKIREMIEACRPASDDLSLPEMAEVCDLVERDPQVQQQQQRVEQWDLAIGAAFHDVKTPDGLKEQLLAAVSEQSDAAAHPRHTAADLVQPAQSQAAWLKRRAPLVGAAVGAVAAATIVIVALVWPPSPPLSAESVAQRVPEWASELRDDEWLDVRNSPPPERFPADPSMAMSADRWQRMQKLGRKGVAFADRPSTSARALLFVLERGRATGLPSDAPRIPMPQTGGWQVGVWQSADLVYVLAVQGDQRDYQDVVGPRGIVAFFLPAAEISS